MEGFFRISSTIQSVSYATDIHEEHWQPSIESGDALPALFRDASGRVLKKTKGNDEDNDD